MIVHTILYIFFSFQTTYYKPKSDTRKQPGGKLVDRSNNVFSRLRKQGIAPRLRQPKRKRTDDTSEKSEETAEGEKQNEVLNEGPKEAKNTAVDIIEEETQYKGLLAQEYGTWEDKTELWEKSYKIRQIDVNGEKDTSQLLQEWPILKEPNSYKLVSIFSCFLVMS